jgi:FMN phosphatase YigB (HAD superfamily)
MAIRVVAFDVHNTLLRWPASRVHPYEVQRFLADYGIDISYQAFEAASAAVFAFDMPKREITCWTDFLALLFGRMNLLVPLDLVVSLANLHETRDAMEPLHDTVAGIQAVKALGLVTCTFTTLPAFMLGRPAADLLLPVPAGEGWGEGDPSRSGRPPGRPTSSGPRPRAAAPLSEGEGHSPSRAGRAVRGEGSSSGSGRPPCRPTSDDSSHHVAHPRHLLDHYFNCTTVGYLKGDRRYYRGITEKLGVAPSEILSVGDHPTSDCLIPAEIGWRSVLLDRTGTHADTQAGQIATIRSLTDLPVVIASLPG